MKRTILKLITEPYIQFLISGIAIYIFYSFSATPNQEQYFQKEIVITSGMQEHLKDIFLKKWQHEPSSKELDLLIEKYYNEEIMIEEALALHLERKDDKIRKYLLTKMRHIVISSSLCSEPDEDSLYQYYKKHLNRYSIVKRIHFFHIFASVKHEKGLGELAEMLKKYSISPQDAMKYGDHCKEGNEISSITIEKLSKQFGYYFAREVSRMPEQKWLGPVRSSKGFHMVYVIKKTGEEPIVFTEAEERVYQDFFAECREKSLQESMQKIVRGYRKKVE